MFPHTELAANAERFVWVSFKTAEFSTPRSFFYTNNCVLSFPIQLVSVGYASGVVWMYARELGRVLWSGWIAVRSVSWNE